MNLRLGIALLFICISSTNGIARDIPKGFVYLRSVDKTIAQDMRYATADNFIGRTLDGYRADECILDTSTANALVNAQNRAKPKGLTLLVYDCYRPVSAVQDMARTIKKSNKTHPLYHPKIPAKHLIKKGYVASRSGHSSGGSVDLTLAKMMDGKLVPLDMGTRFDFFDPASHTRSLGINKKARKNRKLLVSIMNEAGFKNYKREWWHFTNRKSRFSGRHFNFPIVPRSKVAE